MTKKSRMFNLIMILALFLGACNMPSSADDVASTAAAQTIEALLSATPFIGTATPSFTPLPSLATLTPIPPTNTQAVTATLNCNVAEFRSDVTIPDGTIMTPGQTFTKKWRIKNIGSCAWSGYILVFDNGDVMGGPASKPISALNPGQEVDLEVNLTAPTTPGNYRGYWRITTNGNVLIPIVNGHQGTSFYVDIKVQGPATATNTTTPAFAVTTVNFTNTGACGGFTASANVTANGPGSVTYRWVRSDGTADPIVHPPIVYASAGSQSVSTTWNVSAAGTYWIDIYIDTPNHFQFGRASFTCP